MQVFDSLPQDYATKKLTCCYVNATSAIQIARITNISNWYFERVVFPGQRLMFEAVPKACLEIHTGMMASAILTDTIACTSIALQLDEEPEVASLGSQSHSSGSTGSSSSPSVSSLTTGPEAEPLALSGAFVEQPLAS